jgi:hypothetical protein
VGGCTEVGWLVGQSVCQQESDVFLRNVRTCLPSKLRHIPEDINLVVEAKGYEMILLKWTMEIGREAIDWIGVSR